jgi:hypothetical protein
MVHQKKGGIHESNSIFMGTFGWYRLTGLLHQNIWKTLRSVSGHQVYLVAFLLPLWSYAKLCLRPPWNC